MSELVVQRENGCYAACIAYITGIPLDDLPHPTPEELTLEQWNHYEMRLQKFLMARGWMKLTTWLRKPMGLSIMSGPGPRGVDHAVVALDGTLKHDPHPQGGDLLRVDEYEILIQIQPEDTP